MAAPRSNTASWVRSGRSVAQGSIDVFDTIRKSGPDYTSIAKAGLKGRAEQKNAAMKAEAQTKIAKSDADFIKEKADIEIATEASKRAAKIQMAKGQLIGQAGVGLGAFFSKDEDPIKPIDPSKRFKAEEEYIEKAKQRLSESTDIPENLKSSDFVPGQNYSPFSRVAPEASQQTGGGTPMAGGVAAAGSLASGGWKPLSAVIRYGEGTSGDAGYNTQFTGTQFTDMSQHPRQLRSGGGYTSDAAGAYQFLSTTWDEAKGALGLQDFSPASQEKAGKFLTERRGVNPNKVIESKAEFKTVMDKLAPEWASLPYSGISPGGFGQGSSYYGQGGKNLDTLWSIYQQNL